MRGSATEGIVPDLGTAAAARNVLEHHRVLA